jgi:predicted thioesterase
MTLRVEVFEGEVLIGTAIHERVIVDGNKFMNKINHMI